MRQQLVVAEAIATIGAQAQKVRAAGYSMLHKPIAVQTLYRAVNQALGELATDAAAPS